MFYQLIHCGTHEYFKRECGENFNYPLHLHHSFELILVEEGQMTVTVDGTEYILTEGEGVLIFPNQLHSFSSVASRHVLFIFSPRLVQAYWTEHSDSVPLESRVSLDPYLFRALVGLSAQDSKFEIKGMLYGVCGAFDKTAEYKAFAPDTQELLFRILSYVERHFKEDCSLETLAKSVGYNPEYISRFFKKKLKIPYHSYLNMRRLDHAAYLFSNTDATLLTCAMESGYTSLRTFNRNFKSHYGMTPQEYKRKSGRG